MLRLIFVISLLATAGSLYFSVVMGLPACDLCWYQRICMYPIPLLIGIAKWKTNTNIIHPYIGALSGLGALIALYHIFIQTWHVNGATCGIETDCSQVSLQYFGFLTIPIMSLCAFLLIIGCTLFKERNPINKENCTFRHNLDIK